ncbi:MAG: PIN domain-containing protein [Candidatus Wukongarchaeota archaeon]|nr:hypothetical protein [Candidatus Wukongarchaeota archaeon]
MVCKNNFLVLLDTNFLMLPANLGIDIFPAIDDIVQRAYKLVVLRGILGELEKLYLKGGKKQKMAVKLALKFAEKCNILEEKLLEKESIDDYVIRVAEKHCPCAVATVDNILRKRLKDKGIPVIFLRQKTRLEIDGIIP